MKPGPTLQSYYSTDLWIQTYTEQVLVKYGKRSTKYYGYFYSVYTATR